MYLNDAMLDSGALGRRILADPLVSSSLAGKAPSACLYLSGTSGNYVNCPDAAGLDVTGDIDIRIHVALADWTPAALSTLLSKAWVGGNQIAYQFQVNTSGTLRFTWSTAGSTAINKDSTVAVGAADGSAIWVRATLDVDNGASGNDVKFYTSTDGSSWTQLGSTVTTAGTTSVFASSAGMSVGRTEDGTAHATGKFYRAQVRNGIDGTLVADWRGDIPAVRYRDAYGNVWTLNGTANGWMVA